MLLVSGNCFIFNERQSGIKRWRDRASWSPSRMLSNFLLYRERDSEIPMEDRTFHSPATDKKAFIEMEESSRGGRFNRKPYSRPQERALVGCLVDESFKDDGLVKKTISVHYQGEMYHLVSYYKPSDVKSGRLSRPTDDSTINHLRISDELLSQNFRVPLESESRHAAQAAQADAAQAAIMNANNDAINIAANASAAVAAVAAASPVNSPLPPNLMPSVSPVNNGSASLGLAPAASGSTQSLGTGASPTSPKASKAINEKYVAYRPPFQENPYSGVPRRPGAGSRYMYASQE